VILGFVSEGDLIYGHIYDPFRNETFSAWKGGGAFLNGRKIKCCNTMKLADSVVCTGSPPNLESLNACLRATNLISSEVRSMRMLGAASIMLSWLACGRITAYFEAGK
jgi:myo-inositol-1(or 4)-monophosphatase